MSFNSPISAVFIQEDDSIDITPATSLTAGSIVKISDSLIGITKCDIPANALGALHLRGVFSVNKDTSEVDAGDRIYWNSTTSKAGTTATSCPLGFAVADAATGDARVFVRLDSTPAPAGITKQTEITALQDNTGGIPQSSVSDVPENMANPVATIVAKINAIITTLKNAGIFLS